MAITEVMQLPSVNREEGKRFDYKGLHRYIITLQTHDSITDFASESKVFPVLNVLRDVALEHAFDVYAYCFFPKKLVLIVRGKEETSDMKAFLAKFRAAASAIVDPAEGFRLWGRRYTERVLRRTEDTKSIALEVFKQTESDGLAARARDYAFLGAFVVPRGKFFSEFRKVEGGIAKGAPWKSRGGEKGKGGARPAGKPWASRGSRPGGQSGKPGGRFGKPGGKRGPSSGSGKRHGGSGRP